MYELKFHKEIKSDLKKLDASILPLLEKQLHKLQENPDIGIDLGNKSGINLSGYKKMYFYKKKYRIVYKIEKSEILVFVISIGKREDMKVYKEAFLRV